MRRNTVSIDSNNPESLSPSDRIANEKRMCLLDGKQRHFLSQRWPLFKNLPLETAYG